MGASTGTRIARDAPFHDEGHGFDVFGLHPPSLASVIDATSAIYERYFRVDSQGAEHIPKTGPAILVANHGGMLPIDAAMLFLDVVRRTDPPRIPRAVADHFVPRLPLVSTFFARLGVVSGTRANVRYLLERGELIAIFPEGVSGPAKPFRERYCVQHWAVGFAELAIRYRAPVIPVAIIGAEESWPLVMKLRSVRVFGAPYLPIPASLVPLPTHFHIRYGTPLHLDHGHIYTDAENPAIVAAAADTARAAVERLVQETLATRRGVFR